MANYHSLKNAAILAPASNTDLGSPTNKYGNLYMSGNISLNGTSLNSTNAIAPRVTSISYSGDDTAANPAGGQTITLTGSGFVTGANVLINGSVASSTSVVNSTTLTFTSPVLSAGSYVLYVINADGSTAISIPGIQYSGVPTWTTSAGSLGSPQKSTSVSYTVAATGDAPMTYSVYSGALPSGLSLNTSSGVISGTTPNIGSNTVYNFTIRASDGQNQDTDRAFSLTVTASNPATSVQYLIVGGGGGGNTNNNSGGGGGGGVLTGTTSPTAGTPITVTVGAGGGSGSNGGNSVFNSLSAGGGGAGGVTVGTGDGTGSQANSGTVSGCAGGEGLYTRGANPSARTAQSYGSYTQGGSSVYSASYGSAGGGGGGYGGAGGSASIVSSSYASAGNGGSGYSASAWGLGTVSGGGGGSGGSTGGNAGSGGGAANYGGGGNSIVYPKSGSQSGGSGIVVIKYADTYDAAVSTTGSPTITVDGGYRIYQWTSSGSITF